MEDEDEHEGRDGWEIRQAGPANAPRTVLLLPGALCSGEFYEDVFAEPALASQRLVAATVPGFGRTKAPDDMTIENYAHLTGKLAADLGGPTSWLVTVTAPTSRSRPRLSARSRVGSCCSRRRSRARRRPQLSA